MLADFNEFGHFLEGKITAPPIVLIVTGAVIFLVASLGCYGSIRESPRLLMLVRHINYKAFIYRTWYIMFSLPQYAFLLGIIFIVELATGIAACVYKGDLQVMLKGSLEKSIARSSADDLVAWDNVQQKLMCCGVTGPADWVDLSKNKTLRASCCQPGVIDAGSKDCRLSGAVFQHKYYQVHFRVEFLSYTYIFVPLFPSGWLSDETGRAHRQQRGGLDRCRHWIGVHSAAGHRIGLLAGIVHSKRSHCLNEGENR